MTKTNERHSKLDKVRSYLYDIPADTIREPNRPVSVFVGEVQSALAAVREHWSRFEAINFSETWLARAEDGALALAEAQARWIATRETGRSETERALIDRANDFRAELLATADYVFRNDDASQQKLSTIRDGEGLYDLAQDLKDLAALFDANRVEFESVNYDLANCDRARAMSDELLKVHASTAAAKALDEAKTVRDRAFTWTNEALSEIRAAGLYALRNENRPDWLAAFRSQYDNDRKRRSRANRTTSATAAASPSPSAPTTERAPNNRSNS